ncbi:MAG TPA: hypothetical protein VN715_05035 [Roseiarcus sp.]|nr:hypothetical protein [Roseiarcus sp.]
MPKKPPIRKPGQSPSRRRENDLAPLADLLGALDEETLARLRETLRAEIGLDGDDDEDPPALFSEFLRRVQGAAEQPGLEDEELFEDIVATLSEVAIDANGGDARAREQRSAIYQTLDETLAAAGLDAAGLVLVAKILSDSGWSVPDSLKSRVIELLESAESAPSGTSFGDLKSALGDIAEAAEGDAFASYDALNSVLAAFPSQAAARMVSTLGDARAPVLLHTLAGFAMHRDPQLAMAAIEELKRAAKGERVESLLVERLVRMRPWLPADRQAPLDEAIRALRAHALAPVEPERPQAARCFVMACDGSGAGGALASLKAADGWRFVAAMTKPAGVEEVLSLEGLRKSEADATVRGMRDNVLAAQTDAAGIARYLQLILGENLASNLPPPFKFVAFVENLGLGPIAPRLVSPTDLIAEMLEHLPQAGKDAAALLKAHKAVLGGPLQETWFEAGEPVERLLAPIRGAKARAKALLATHLPQRRAFWTRNCALTAFVLQLDAKAHGGLGRSLALVGRDIAAGMALDNIPLMRQIAEMTVRAYESQQ